MSACPYRVDVVAVVIEHRPSSLDVAHTCELQLEVDAVGLSLGLELGDLVTERVGGLYGLRGIRHLLLKRRDPLVALGDGLLPVHAVYLRLLLRRLLVPAVFLGLRLFLRLYAMVITSYVGRPFVTWPTKAIGPLTFPKAKGPSQSRVYLSPTEVAQC